MTIGFIGLGRMGAVIALKLQQKLAAEQDGQALLVYNRSPGKDSELIAAGAEAVRGLAAFSAASIVFSMLSDDKALGEIVLAEGGLLSSLPAGALHVSLSTVSPALSARLAAAHRAAGQRYIAAPVFGRPDAAALGKLFIVAAGAAADIETAQPLFTAFGQQVFIAGEKPEAANLIKLTGNFLIASVIESLGEALALTGKAGIDPHFMISMLTASLFPSPVYRNYGGILADGVFEPAGFLAPLGLKDIRLALAAAEELQVALPIASLLRDRFLALLAQGGENLDWAAIGGLAGRDAGLNPAPIKT